MNIHERLTAIIGESDVGKSSIIRAIKYLVTNKPRRNNFPNDQQKDEKFKIAVTDGKNTVVRSRLGGTNSYSVNGRVSSAIGSKVPDDVQALLNLSEVNIQSQDEHFFLVDKSPGKVSRELNKVAGLSEIDHAIKNIKSDTRVIKSDLGAKKAELKAVDDKILALKWVSDAEEDLNKLLDLEKTINIERQTRERLKESVIRIENERRQISLMLPDSFGEDIKAILQLKSEIISLQKKETDLKAHILRITRLQNEFNTKSSIDIRSIEKQYLELSNMITELNEIQDILDEIKLLSVNLNNLEIDIKRTAVESGKFEFCPTCERIL